MISFGKLVINTKHLVYIEVEVLDTPNSAGATEVIHIYCRGQQHHTIDNSDKELYLTVRSWMKKLQQKT